MPNALPLNKHQLSTAASTALPIASAPSYQGLFVAGFIMATWATSLAILLKLPLEQQPFWTPLAVLWQTFLYAGLFVTAHDAMHGVISPNPKINRFVGTLTLLLYGLFSYSQLFKTHWQHHHHPAS